MSLIEADGRVEAIASARERKEAARRAAPAAITVGQWEDMEAAIGRLARISVTLGERLNMVRTQQLLDHAEDEAVAPAPGLILPDRFRN